MAKGIYLGINSLSRKVKKMYLGIEGVARKVKKGYVGVNGIARLFFSGRGIDFVKSLADLPRNPTSFYGVASAKSGNYAVFSPGIGVKNPILKVIAYDTNLVQYNTEYEPEDISAREFGGVGFEEFALFCGGSYDAQTGGQYDTVWTCCSSELTFSHPSIKNLNSYMNSGCKFGNSAIFSGGAKYNGSPAHSSYVYSVDSSLTLQEHYGVVSNKRIPDNLESLEEYCMIGPGPVRINVGNHEQYVSVISSDFTKIGSDLKVYNIMNNNDYIKGFSGARLIRAGDHILVVGGFGNNETVTIIDSSLVVSQMVSPTPRYMAGVISYKRYGMVFGGINGEYSDENVLSSIDVYDEELTITNSDPMSSASFNSAAVALEDYVLVGGGAYLDSGRLENLVNIDAYSVN